MRHHSNRLLLQIYLPFVAFIVIPMLLLNAAIFQLLHEIRERDYRDNLAQTEAAGSYLNTVIQESVATSRKIYLDDTLQRLAYADSIQLPQNCGQLYLTNAHFQKYFAMDNNTPLHIFYAKSMALISTSGACHNLSYFYDRSYQFGGYSLDQLTAMAEEADRKIRFHPRKQFLVDSTSYEGFFYTTALDSSTSPQQGKGLILTVIRRELVEEILAPLNENGGFSYITDQDGNLLDYFGSYPGEIQPYFPKETKGYLPEEVYGGNYTVSYICLSEGINVYNAQPSNSIFQNTRMLMFIALFLNLTSLAVCLAIAIPLVTKRSRKVHQIFSLLGFSGLQQSRDYYDSINQGITDLLDTNHKLSTSLAQDIFLFRAEFWEKLLRGSFSSEAELEEAAVYSDINLNSDYFCLAILAVRKGSSLSDFLNEDGQEDEVVRLYRSMLLDDLESKTILRGYCHNMSVQQTVLLLRVSEAEKAEYQDLVEEILKSVPYPPPGLCVNCGGSRLFSSVMDVRDEYAYCSNILLQDDTLASGELRFVWSEGEYLHSSRLYFPRQLSDRMAAAIRGGNSEEVSGCFREIFTHNFDTANPITPSVSTSLIIRFKLLMEEVYREDMGFELHKTFKQIDALPSDAVKMTYFIRLANQMCEYYQKSFEQKTEKLRRKIVAYVNENFNQPSFSLADAASHCGFSDSYFSVLFRELMEENFSSYVERKKMEFADRLLLKTNLKVEEIAKQTGYTDTNAFRRSYKKYFSVSPSQRRHDHQG